MHSPGAGVNAGLSLVQMYHVSLLFVSSASPGLCFQACMVWVSDKLGTVRQSSYLLPTLPQDLYRQNSPFNFSVAKISPRQLRSASHMWAVKPSPAPIRFS